MAEAAEDEPVRFIWQARIPLDTEPVHDGDTIRLELDLGFNQRGVYPLRLRDVFAPELKQPGGEETREFVRVWLNRNADIGWPFMVETFRTKGGRDLTTLERYVAIVWPQSADHLLSLNVATINFLLHRPDWSGGVGG